MSGMDIGNQYVLRDMSALLGEEIGAAQEQEENHSAGSPKKRDPEALRHMTKSGSDPTIEDLEVILAAAELAAEEDSFFNQKKLRDDKKPVLRAPENRATKEVPSLLDLLDLSSAEAAAEEDAFFNQKNDQKTASTHTSGANQANTGNAAPKKTSVYEVLARIRENVDQGSITVMAANGQLKLAKLLGIVQAAARLEKLADELESLKDQLADAIQNLPGGSVATLLAQIAQLERDLADVETILSTTQPGSPEHTAALQRRDQLQNSLTTARAALAPVTALQTRVEQKLEEYDAIAKQLELGQPNSPGNSNGKVGSTLLARLLDVMANLAELIEELSDLRTELQGKFLKLQHEQRIAQLEKEAKKLEKKPGFFKRLVSKIVKAVMAVVSPIMNAIGLPDGVKNAVEKMITMAVTLLLSPYAASLNLFSALKGFMKGETNFKEFGMEIVQAIISPITEVMESFKELVLAVLPPGAVHDWLEKNFDQVLGIVIAIVAMAVAIASTPFTFGAGIGLVIGAIALAVNTVDFALNQAGIDMYQGNQALRIGVTVGLTVASLAATFASGMIAQLLQKLPQEMAKKLKDMSSNLEKTLHQLQKGATYLSTAGTVYSSAVAVDQAIFEYQIAQAQKNIKVLQATLAVLEQMLAALSEMAIQAFEESTQIWDALSHAIQTHGSTGRVITHAIRTAGRA